MRDLLTNSEFYTDVHDWIFLFQHCALKTQNEAVVESQGSCVDTHAAGQRRLSQEALIKETFVHWNGPAPQHSDGLLKAALDHHFTGKKWHFTTTDSRANLTMWFQMWLTVLCQLRNNNTATQMWKALTGTAAMVGFSNIRWWSRQEVENEIALHFNSVPVLLQQLLDEGVGDATTRNMLGIFHADPLRLEVSFAAGYDGLTDLLATTYAMEGDRLGILLVYMRVESLRKYGRALVDDIENRGLLLNVDAVIRRARELKVGAAIRKEFPGYGTFTDRVSSIDKKDRAENGVGDPSRKAYERNILCPIGFL
ncbi:hypothetical protein CYMTET_39988 [Cymbomonas tetramitiformis]|uniref:Uncharacterized protein n=1 Tax=Cymbomonas tetramitiformis TaxID=36881 RepID=A0AAE0F3P9_9CHLO|nr:hypothetical protein CYMTET_39988 [Cymbomonas tetramitiformis]